MPRTNRSMSQHQNQQIFKFLFENLNRPAKSNPTKENMISHEEFGNISGSKGLARRGREGTAFLCCALRRADARSKQENAADAMEELLDQSVEGQIDDVLTPPDDDDDKEEEEEDDDDKKMPAPKKRRVE